MDKSSKNNKPRWDSIFYLPKVLSRIELVVWCIFILIGLISLLAIIREINKSFSVAAPTYGGTLREGIIGNPRFINPLLAQTDADRDIVTLTYSGLLRHDGEGNLIPALAEKYEISSDGLQYTVYLKNNLMWPDGYALTADDVVFTVNLAKNPQIQSSKRANWEGIEIEKIDDKTLRFHLKKAYSPFIENLTLGIVPKHIWSDIAPSQFSLVELNTNAIGAGPYIIKSINKNSRGSIVSIKLEANKKFVLGRPFINNIQLYFYPNEETIIKNLQNAFLDSSGAVSPKEIESLNKNKILAHTMELQRIIAIFFNSNNNKNLASVKIRNTLNQSIDKNFLVEQILNNFGVHTDSPLPLRIIKPANTNKSYNPQTAQKSILNNKEPLRISITTTNNIPEFTKAAELIKKMWEDAGATVDIKTFDENDLEQLVIGPRRYEAFLYGEEIIGKNPDLFAFWHSSQRSHPGLNIALYTNSKVDNLLEKVRAEQNAAKQKEMYEEIDKEIKKDAPAVFLYSPFYIYITPKNLKGFNVTTINTASERFETIHKWYLNTQYIWKIFAK